MKQSEFEATSESITKKIGELFTFSVVNQYIRIEAPFLYPDGDVIDLFYYKEEGTNAVLTDLGETIRWLDMQTVEQEETPEQRLIINDICINYGIERYRGMLQIRLKQPDDLAEAVMRLLQAVLRVSDVLFTLLKSKMSTAVVDKVENLLRQCEIPFERKPEIKGESGRIWGPDFRTKHPERSALIFILSTSSPITAREETDHTLAAWYDLRYLTKEPKGVRFISLFDDT